MSSTSLFRRGVSRALSTKSGCPFSQLKTDQQQTAQSANNNAITGNSNAHANANAVSTHPSLKADELDVDVVRDLLQHPVALAHCPYAQRAALAHDAAPDNAALAGATTSQLPAHVASLFDNTLRELRNKQHYRTFRYLRRVVGMHPFVRMHLVNNNSASAAVSASAASADDVHDSSPALLQRCAEPTLCEACTCDMAVVPAAQRARLLDLAPTVTEAELHPERWVVNWCSNDYLNLSHHEQVCGAMRHAIEEQGAGAGGTRNISGSQSVHAELERELAQLCGHEAALLFNSCYSANLGVMQTLGRILPKDAIVLSDQENHASLVEGIKASGMNKAIFRHNDLAHLEELLAAQPAERVKVVVFESVYSMSGTKSDTKATLEICEKYGAISFIDEVHAVGLYGEHGAGVMEEVGIRGRATIISGTLGKAYGTLGGFVTSNASIIDCVRSTAPSFIFTTSISPAIASGALAAVRIASGPQGREYRKGMRSMAAWLQTSMRAAGLPVLSDASHIVPLIVGDEATCRAICDELLHKHSVYVQPICFPSVPRGEALLRITCSPKHTPLDAEHLLQTLVPLFSKHGVLTAQQKSEKVLHLLKAQPALPATEQAKKPLAQQEVHVRTQASTAQVQHA
jgi:5-aminolevulinate synthase